MIQSSRRRGVALLTAALAALGLIMVPAPAYADEGDDHDGVLSCPLGHYQQEYHPSLQPVTQHVTLEATGSFGPCTSLTRPDLNNAAFHVSGSGDLNCLTGGNSAGTMLFHWNTGHVTRVDYPVLSLTIRPTGQTVVILTGEVVSGPFAGGTLVFQSNLLVDDPLACLTGGVDSAAGPASASFVDL